MKQDNSPITLSGRVFVDKLLAHEHPGLDIDGRRLQKGDIKVIAIAKSNHKGHVKGCCPEFAGFFSAYVYDGKAWRKFALRDGAAVASTYDDRADRRNKLHECVAHLRTLGSVVTTWGKGTFVVPRQAKPLVAPSAVPAAKRDDKPAPAAVAPAVKPGKPVQLTLF